MKQDMFNNASDEHRARFAKPHQTDTEVGRRHAAMHVKLLGAQCTLRTVVGGQRHGAARRRALCQPRRGHRRLALRHGRGAACQAGGVNMPASASTEAPQTNQLKKLLHREDAAALARLLRPMVFTNGVFDILHRGDRACVRDALEAVILFDEATPLALLAQCRPDVYVKGGDHVIEDQAETPLVRSWPGRALALPFVQGYSTTARVRRINATGDGR